MIATDTILTTTRVHVSLYSNIAIDQLVSQRIFKQSKVCHGRMEASMKPGLHRCTVCESLVEETPAMRIFDDASGGHARATPCFTTDMAAAWLVMDALRGYPEEVQICFALFLRILVQDDFSLSHPAGKARYSLQRFLFGMSPRSIAIAALQAIDAIDTEGYVKENEVGW